MTTSINTILNYNSIDLSAFEIRGAKSGVDNARTTGPVYVSGSYIPSKNTLIGDASFSHDSSVVTNLSFSAYPSLDASALRMGDSMEVNNSTYTVQKQIGVNSIVLDSDVGSLDGTHTVNFALTSRDYVIEPDVVKNTGYGKATFTNGSKFVTGIGTNWGVDLIAKDFIKSSNYQNFYKVATIHNTSYLELVSPFQGTTTTTDYTSKKWYVGITDIRYATDNVNYDNQKAEWTYDGVEKSNLPTSTVSRPLADGIDLRFTHTLTSTAPDIMDVATVTNKTFSRKTLYDTFQYALPVVPYSDTLELRINNVVKDQFPSGNQDYVLNYTQNPVYTPPPPPTERQVANVMFLKGIQDIKPDWSVTSSGQFYTMDSSGNSITGLMPGSEKFKINGNLQTAYKDYILEPNSGLVNIVNSRMDEPVVKYVAVNYNSQIDYGLSIYLNSKRQKISFPLSASDDVIFQPASGRMKPANQDHPGPDDVYEVHYVASATDSITNIIQAYPGQYLFKTSVYPIQQNSFLLRNSDGYLTEGVDYVVGYLTGTVLLSSAIVHGDTYTLVYTPLSKQVNQLTYTDSTAYCTVVDSRLGVIDPANFRLALNNKIINAPDDTEIVLKRVYNETRKAEYDLSNSFVEGYIINLYGNTANRAIGLNVSDVVVADYRLTQETIEYAPAQIIHMTLQEGSNRVYFEGLNLTSSVFVGSVIIFSVPDSIDQYLFRVFEVLFDGVGTRVTLSDSLLEDINDPNIYISDAPVTFISYSITMEPLVSGSNTIVFKGADYRPLFRPSTVINISNNCYQVYQSSFDSGNTTVTLTSTAKKDYLNVTTVLCSDQPVYIEGETEIYTEGLIVSLSQQPALIMNYSKGTIRVDSDSSKITVNGTDFRYDTYPKLVSLVPALNGISGLTATTYVPSWKSNKIFPVSNVPVFPGSNTILYADNALRYKGVDTTNYSLSGSGTMSLTNPLRKFDRYHMDYMGLRFLASSKVEFSTRYFTTLPAGSNVKASFLYNNLDQFYVQVMSQRDFLENVTIPRMTEEANQLNGNMGQGGEVAGDSDTGSSSGGLSGDEYRRQDAAIECDVFKTIYDFFQDRLNGYKLELEAGMGYRLFNTDGTFSEEQQQAGTQPINRIFPIGYSGINPRTCNPLTGYFFETGAIFSKGSAVVRNFYAGSSWLSQLTPGGFIAKADSSKYYKILSVDSNEQVTLDRTYEEASTRKRPDRYQACGLMPYYDDDGYMGPKLISASVNQTSGWGLVNNDAFICNIDGSDSTYIFQDPAVSFNTIPSYVAYAIQPLPSRLNTSQVIEQLNTIPGLSASYSTVLDPEEPYGYRNTIVLHTDGTFNTLSLSSSPSAQAVSKLGFIPGASSRGNYDRTDLSPEIVLAVAERDLQWLDLTYLNYMMEEVNKLDRLIYDLPYITPIIQGEIDLLSGEIPKIETEIYGTGLLIKEPTIGTFSDCSTSHLNATVALQKAVDTSNNDALAIVADWRWPIDFTWRTQGITGLDGTNSLTLTASYGNDTRILNWNSYVPVVRFASDSSIVAGTWEGWDSTPSINSTYSITNTVVFTMAQTPVITLTQDGSISNAYYIVDQNGLTLYWDESSVQQEAQLYYTSYATIGAVVYVVNNYTDFTAACDPSMVNWDSRSFQISTGTIAPDATVYYGLRDAVVEYQTISDRLVIERTITVTDRYDYLNDTRIPYLEFRENQLKSNLMSEELLRTSTGAPGDVYAWANNRFNRRQGCYARLGQIEAQIASNQSALNINKGFM